jgi:hypothetical protein
MCGRVIQSSGPLRYGIVEGMDMRESRAHNYPRRWNAAPSQDLLVTNGAHASCSPPLRQNVIDISRRLSESALSLQVHSGWGDSLALGIENHDLITVVALVVKCKFVSVIRMCAGCHFDLLQKYSLKPLFALLALLAVLVSVRGAEFDGEKCFAAYLFILFLLRLFLFSVAALLTLRHGDLRTLNGWLDEWRSVAHSPARRYTCSERAFKQAFDYAVRGERSFISSI